MNFSSELADVLSLNSSSSNDLFRLKETGDNCSF